MNNINIGIIIRWSMVAIRTRCREVVSLLASWRADTPRFVCGPGNAVILSTAESSEIIELGYLKECLTANIRPYVNYLTDTEGPHLPTINKDRINIAASMCTDINIMHHIIDTYCTTTPKLDRLWYLNIVLEDRSSLAVLNTYSEYVNTIHARNLTYFEFSAICKLVALMPLRNIDKFIRDVITYDIVTIAESLPVAISDVHCSYLLTHASSEEELLLASQIVSCWEVLESMGWYPERPDSVEFAVTAINR